MGCSPWACKESDMPEHVHTHTHTDTHTHTHSDCRLVGCNVFWASPIAMRFPHSSIGKESACNAEDPGLITGLGGFSGEGIGYPLQFSWAFLWLSW